MRALRAFTVRVQLPVPLAPLQELATNLRWSWDGRTRDLFRWVDPDGWERSGHDPVALLSLVRPERLADLADDPSFLRFLHEVHADLRRYLEASRWFQRRQESPLRAVAYFSPEFGIAEALPQYSGGLGVLAGDHLKAANSLGLPLVGMGLLYRQGYFSQQLGADGWQQERYPALDPHAMAMSPLEGLSVTVDLAGSELRAQVWQADVGRVRLFLLDSDFDDNDEAGRMVTDRLYGGGTEHRLRQEILLGVGGVRALEALGQETQVFHTNEGHAGFLGLERIRRLVVGEGLSFAEAVEAVRAGAVFTTHTPVPAGIDRFSRDLMARYFSRWAEECGVGFEELLALGHLPADGPDAPFNMAVMGLRLAGVANGVSRLHARVSRAMFAPLWPGLEDDEVPITSVTNGVHAATWVSQEMDDLLAKSVLPRWSEAAPGAWDRINDVPDDQLWRARQQGRERLVGLVRARLRASLESAGAGAHDLAWCDEVLDPGILTIGFARRFASYKRANLLLSQPERLEALLLSAERPVQLVYAGKAHPADQLGKEMIRQIVQFSRRLNVRHRMAFVENYDIAVARAFYQGCDLWLNTPRRPLEACGTSGMKAALNGALNCSVLDGWWDESYNGENGWAIFSAEGEQDEARRDAIEASSLFDLLERQVVPLFYDRLGGNVPRRWVARVKASLRSLGHQVVAPRMVRDYTETIYEPVAARADALGASGAARARALAAWKARVAWAWPGVRVESAEADPGSADLGTKRTVEAVVTLGSLEVSDVAVELVHGPVGANDELMASSVTTMEPADPADGEALGGERRRRYAGSFVCEQAGRYGFSVRVVPSHADLASPAETGLINWA